MNNKKSDDFLYIEKCFTAIKNKVAINENFNKLNKVLNKLFDINFTFSIVENNTNNFFGMTIYPTVSTMDILIKSILDKDSKINDTLEIWRKNTEWYVEIDSILLYDASLNSNPAEITAILLHEIGHVVYNNTIPQRLHTVIKYKIIKMNYQLRQLAYTDKIRKLFNIAIVDSCSSKNYSYIDNNSEKIADKFTVRYGYGDELNNFINKLIKSQGSSLVDKTDDEMEREIKSTVNWTVMNITELEYRKKALRTTLKVELLKNPGAFTKRIIQDIYTEFFGEATDKYRMLLSEQAGFSGEDKYNELLSDQMIDNFVHRVLTEAYNNIFDKNGKLKKITQNDIDILAVESERINNTDDKIYLLDKLYSQLELVNMGLDYIESNEKEMTGKITQSRNTLIDMKKQLEELRNNILSAKIIDKKYGIYLKMPVGYEG